MICRTLATQRVRVGLVLGAALTAVVINGCTVDTGVGEDRDQGIAEQEGGESGGEHGSGGEGSEGSGGEGSGGEGGEAAMSSPITPLGESWTGGLGGLAVSMQYDAATESIHGTVRNTLSQKLCYVQAEPHLKLGTKTVGELGPEKLGDLNPGQEATSRLTVASEPGLAGVAYDGYVIHMEVFDCSGPGPAPHAGGEDTAGDGSESGHESGAGSEEGSGATLGLDETFDAVRGGARLNLNYDAPSNSFRGTVENTTDRVLGRVRIEVHLSNGTELGPTTPTDMAPGEVMAINLPATPESFTGWIAHAEAGTGDEGSQSSEESGGEHGSSPDESGGEHGGDGEYGGEHGGDGEYGGEHGGDGE